MSLFHSYRRIILSLPVWLASMLLSVAIAHAAPPDAGTPYSLARLIDRAIRNHPSIAARHAEVKAMQAEVDAARAQYYPTRPKLFSTPRHLPLIQPPRQRSMPPN